MNKSGLFLALFLTATAATISVASAQSCKACNCQFNNVQALSQLIEVQVNQILANEPRKLKPIIILCKLQSLLAYIILRYLAARYWQEYT